MTLSNNLPDLPSKFPALVGAVIDTWKESELPANKEEIWEALMYPMFLGQNVRSAQASYIKNVLSNYVSMEEARKLGEESGWRDRVLEKINSKLINIDGTLGEGYKSGILNSVKNQVENYELSRSLLDGVNYIDDNNIDAQKVEDLKFDRDQQIKLVVLASQNVHNVGLIKSVLWFYNCGIAKRLAPPNSHVKGFLKDCNVSLSFNDLTEEEIEVLGGKNRARGILYSVSDKMEEVTQKVESNLSKPLTVREVQSAVWFLQTCKKLDRVKYLHTDVTPERLLKFLDEHNWNMSDLSERLNDVERLDGVGEKLRNFLQSL